MQMLKAEFSHHFDESWIIAKRVQKWVNQQLCETRVAEAESEIQILHGHFQITALRPIIGPLNGSTFQ